ncbi:insulinase family protein [bacterium]|nr:insulinase family protein [bacterium]
MAEFLRTDIVRRFLLGAFLSCTLTAGVWGESLPYPVSNSKPELSKTYTIGNYGLSGSNSLFAGSLVNRNVLSNGFVCLTLEIPEKNLVCFEYLVRCGVSQESSNLQGFNNLVLKLLSDRITADAENDDVVEITGSVVEDGASQDFSRISIVTSASNGPFMLRRLCRAISQGDFSTEEVEKARKSILGKTGESGGTSGRLYDIFLSSFYRLHPYKRSVQNVPVILKRLTAEEVNAYYRANFTSDRSVLTIAGKFNAKSMLETVKENCQKLRPASEKILEVQWEPQAVEKEVYLYSQSELAWVLVGYQAPELQSADYPAMQVIYGALGAGLSSRLWTELRENRGLAYEVGARYPDLVGPSHLLCHVITKPTSAGVARRRILAEIERLKKEGMSREELAETKEKLAGAYLAERESLSGRALHLSMAELSGAGGESDASYLKNLQAVTAEDIKRVADKYLREPTIIIARPGGRLYWDW